MRIIATGTFHRAGKDSKVIKPGTLMYHYAVDGTKAELEAYEEAKGANYSTIDKGTHTGKPFFCSSRKLANEGEWTEVTMDKNGNINAVQTLAEAEADQAKRNAATAESRKREELFILAAKHGVALQVA